MGGEYFPQENDGQADDPDDLGLTEIQRDRLIRRIDDLDPSGNSKDHISRDARIVEEDARLKMNDDGTVPSYFEGSSVEGLGLNDDADAIEERIRKITGVPNVEGLDLGEGSGGIIPIEPDDLP